jgi:hypothetical protein
MFIRAVLVSALAFLSTAVVRADDIGFIDCYAHSDTVQVQATRAKTSKVLAPLPCGERFTILLGGEFYSRIQTKGGVVGYVQTYLISHDDSATAVTQTTPESEAPKADTATRKPAFNDSTQAGFSGNHNTAYASCEDYLDSVGVYRQPDDSIAEAHIGCGESVQILGQADGGVYERVLTSSGVQGFVASASLSGSHPIHETVPTAQTSSRPTPSPVAQTGCSKNVSFGIFENGRMFMSEPDWVAHWVQKNENHYASICFSQTPQAGATNFLMVLSNSSQSFSGFDPVIRTNTTTDTTPVSGSGTVTNNYGGMWSYTYDGTVTTTTTTTTQENVPYALNSNSLYVYTFDEHGTLVSRRWKTLTTKQGGEPFNTLGYNLGAALGAINFKSGLLKGAVKDVCGSKKCD